LQNGLSVSGVASFWQQIITGAILIAAVGLDRLQREGSLNVRLPRGRRTAAASASGGDG